MEHFSTDIRRRQQLAVRAARAAGHHTLQYFSRGQYKIDRKSDGSPVTDADREAESLLRDLISAEFPSDGIIGEEFPERASDSEFQWILDPIDGTKSFISGVPLYGTLIGVQQRGSGVIGVIEMPALDERVYAAKGAGAWHIQGDGPTQRAQVTHGHQLGEGLLLTSEIEGWQQRGAIDVLLRLQQASWFTRTWGDCYGYLLVATGRATAMIDPRMNVWDAAAVQPILEEAGGTFCDWQGNPTVNSGDGIGTNRYVLDEILNVTRNVGHHEEPGS